MRLNWMKRSSVIAIAGAILLTMAIVGFSQGPQHGPRGRGFHGGPGGPPGGLGPLGRDINLSEEQKAQIKKIRDSFEESTRSLREQMRTLHESADPLSGAAFDEAAVRTAAQARAGVQVELEVAHARMMSQILAILTPEQKTQLAARRQEFEQRRRAHDEEHRNDRGGERP
ncbi:MAG TPA: Spy/CpxP family protein refolding chaperone [Pyrinomonadaceae bacterium]